jgi:glutamate transport system permease protein
MSATTALRFADPLGPRGRRRVVAAPIVAAVVLAIVVALALQRFADNGQFAWRLWKPFFTADAVRVYGGALGNTLRAAAVAMVLATFGGLLLAIARVSSPLPVRIVVTGWVEFFRGIPLALLLVFLFFGLPRLGFDVGNYWFLVMALALYNSAVISEIVRAGVLSLDRGQTEAALAVGLTDGAALRLVVLPQALRRMIPALVSQMVVVLKDTSLGVTISYEELLRRAQLAGSAEAARLQALFFAALIYLLVNLCLSLFARRLERRQGRVRRAARAGEIHVRGVEDLTV